MKRRFSHTARRPRPGAAFRRCAAFACALACLLLVVGCGGAASAPERKKLTIAWVSKSLGNPVFELGQRGAVQRAQELSAQGPIAVELLTVGPASADAIEQARIMDDLIARGVDGIAVSCNDPTACAAPIDRAAASGIPVMTWDSDSPQSQRFSFLSIDNYASGRTAADQLAAAIGGRGKVAIITGVPGALNLQQRVDGFNDRLAEAYPEMQVVRVFASNEDINLGVQGVEETMQAHPDLRGWFFAGLWPLFADRGSMPLWEAAARKGAVKTVVFDSLPFELDLLRDGYVQALIGQKYWRWGYDSVQMVYDRVVSGKDYPAFIDTGVDIVTQKNVDAMAQAWKTNDFSKPLPAP
jgi:ribose transport system substrate-binding protein